MKRLIAKLSAVVMLLAISLNASAYSFLVDGVYYNILSTTDNTCGVAPKNGNDNKQPDGSLIEKAPYNKDAYKGVVTIPQTVTYQSKEYTVTDISSRAFINCSELIEVKMPNTIKSIGVDAFFGCTKLKKLIIPKSVNRIITYIEENKWISYKEAVLLYISCFKGCDNLTELSVEEGNEDYKCSGNVLVYRNKTAVFGAHTSSLEIPEGVTYIDYGAFYGNKAMTELSLPGSLRGINKDAFEGCSNLKKLRINKGKEDLSVAYLYDECQIKELYLDRIISNKSINVFNLNHLVIGPNLMSVGQVFSNSKNLTQIDCKGPSLINISDNAFSSDIYLKATVRVPIGTSNAYTSHSAWSKFANINEEFKLEGHEHDLSYDKFEYNNEDSICTLITAYGVPAGEYSSQQYINRGYVENVNGYKLIGIGDGVNPLRYTLSISLPRTVQYINDYSLNKILGTSSSYLVAKEDKIKIPIENDLKYIGAYAFPANPFDRFRLHINKECKVHEYAFATKGSSIQFLSNLTIDSDNPYIGLDGGVIFFKGFENVVRYFIHETENAPAIIPHGYTHIENISTTTSLENISFEDESDITYLRLTNCNLTNKNALSFNNIDTITNELFKNCTFDIKKISFPNAKFIKDPFEGVFKHLHLGNVETLETEYLFKGTADTLSVYVKNNLGTKLFAGSTIKRLNWLNEEIPFAESMEEYANRIDVLNLGNAKSVGIRGVMYSLKNRKTESLILLSTPTPPEVLSIVLYDDYPTKVKLYVPAGSGEAYRNHEKWGVIPNIIEYDVNGPDPTSGVGNIVNDKQLSVDVYSLQGVLVRKGVKRDEATQGLPQGVYIVGGEKVIIK